MIHKFLGAMLLVVGTSIGAAMLALPTVVAGPGFINSLGLFFICWSCMTFGAFLILEVNLLYPEDSNLISMARNTLGVKFGFLTWVVYLLLLYTLLSAYISAIGDILFDITSSIFIHPFWLDVLIIGMLFGFFIYKGIKVMDNVNKLLMLIKLILFLILIASFIDLIKIEWLFEGDLSRLPNITLVLVTSFGFAIIVPSIRKYLNSDIKLLRKALLFGSLIPLGCYLIWCFIVLGVIPTDILNNIASSDHSVAELVRAFSLVARTTTMRVFAMGFYTLCVLTSFLGISLCLADFLDDGVKNTFKKNMPRSYLALFSLVPPMLVAVFYPKAFLMGFRYAGYWVIYILIILPVLMVWNSRYRLKTARDYQVWGGKLILALEMVLALLFLFIAAK